ncbi:MAG: serine hydrolase domain-containing protein [Parvibaculum sp.]|nr:serine hydrolase domain-containing protein [Parvibaculum sp.]
MTSLPIDGFCDPRFAPVRAAFIDNFKTHNEPGAAVTVMLHGETMVDIWGGWRDAAREVPWAETTLVNFFSVGKPLAALCLLRLVERGLASLDDPVARFWPEFAAHGKDKITLRHILSHQAGLPAIAAPLPPDAMLNWPQMIAAIEAQVPWWEPGKAHGYHVNTFGFLVGEVVRRLTGKSIGRYFHDEISLPLGLDIFFGVPVSEHNRIADFLWPDNAMPGAEPAGLTRSQSMRWNTYWNPAGVSGAGYVNAARWRSAEIPSTNGHGTARSVARLYAALARGGTLEGIEIIGTRMLTEAITEQSAGMDMILERDTRFGLGFQLPRPERPLGPNAGAFGHFGAGGSLGFCDPDTGISFAYVTNDMGPRWQNPRNAALMDATFSSLKS